MSDVLSADWCAQVTSRLADLPPGAGGSGVVALTVSGGDAGRVESTWVVEDGRVISISLDGGAEPEVVAPLSRRDAEAVVAGELDPAEAFMRGDLKPDGSARAWFAWLSALARDDVRTVLAA